MVWPSAAKRSLSVSFSLRTSSGTKRHVNADSKYVVATFTLIIPTLCCICKASTLQLFSVYIPFMVVFIRCINYFKALLPAASKPRFKNSHWTWLWGICFQVRLLRRLIMMETAVRTTQIHEGFPTVSTPKKLIFAFNSLSFRNNEHTIRALSYYCQAEITYVLGNSKLESIHWIMSKTLSCLIWRPMHVLFRKHIFLGYLFS